jgi:hypothetical protein
MDGFWVQMVTGDHYVRTGECLTWRAASKDEAEDLAIKLSTEFDAIVDVMVTVNGSDTFLGCKAPGNVYRHA